MLRLTGIMLAALLIGSGCAVNQVVKTEETASGKPEIVIQTKDLDLLKALIMEKMAGHGYTLDSESRLMLSMWRPAVQSESMAGAFYVQSGGADSRRVTRFTMIPRADNTKVMVFSGLEVSARNGRTRLVDWSGDGAVFNVYQADLKELKRKVEGDL